MAILKLPNNMYVGVHAHKQDSGFPLAFATPDGDDAQAKKRKETVDQWAAGYSSRYSATAVKPVGKVYPNTPRTGFKIVDWASRYSTNNKAARIVDPHGYELEIYIPNLIALILECEIDKGEIKAELVWIRDGTNNRLVRADSADAKEAAKVVDKPKKLRHVAGDIIDTPYGVYLYLGLFDAEAVIPSGNKIVDEKITAEKNRFLRPWHGQLPSTYYLIESTSLTGASLGRKHVYIKQNPYHRGEIRLATRTSQMATYNIMSSNNAIPSFDENTVWGTEDQLYYDDAGGVHSINTLPGNFWNDVSISYWEVTTVRINNGKMNPITDPTQIKKK